MSTDLFLRIRERRRILQEELEKLEYIEKVLTEASAALEKVIPSTSATQTTKDLKPLKFGSGKVVPLEEKQEKDSAPPEPPPSREVKRSRAELKRRTWVEILNETLQFMTKETDSNIHFTESGSGTTTFTVLDIQLGVGLGHPRAHQALKELVAQRKVKICQEEPWSRLLYAIVNKRKPQAHPEIETESLNGATHG